MRRTIQTILLMLTSLVVGAQTNEMKASLGIDLTAAVRTGSMGIGIGHAFHPHWTVGGCVRFPFRVPADEDEEYCRHRQEFEKDRDEQEEAREETAAIGISYWPVQAFKGPHISIGGRYARGGIPGGRIGAGYAVELSRRLNAEISIETEISSKASALEGTGITVMIRYLL